MYVALLLQVTEAYAGGLSFIQNGAAAMGKGDAFAGEANDPSALYYNPAGITQLPGTQLMIGSAIVYLDTKFRSSTTGESTRLEDQFPLVPHVYVTHRFKTLDERLTVGLGIYQPFGILIDWPDNWQGRFATTNAKLRVTVFNPTIAFQVTNNLSVAAGAQVADVAAEFEQKFAIPAFGIGESKIRAHDLTARPVGWNAALLYHVTDNTSAGLVFRSELLARLKGEADFTGPAAAVFTNTGFHSNLRLPPQVVGGISTKIIPRWTFNADIVWEGWKTVGTIPKEFVGIPPLDSSPPRLWRNSMAYRVGVEYAASNHFALRSGYFYDESPIPDNTFNPTVPNANIHALTIGLGYKASDRVTIDTGYLIAFFEKRSIDNGTIDPDNQAGPTTFGSYSTTAHVVAVSVTMRF